MSAIAEFHVFPASQLENLMAAAEPQTRIRTQKWLFFLFLFKETADQYHEFLHTQGQAQKAFKYSGYVFNELQFILEDQQIHLFKGLDLEPSASLSKQRGGTELVLSFEETQALLTCLKPIKISDARIRQELEETYEANEISAGIKAVKGAFAILKEWLATVKKDQIGLLSIG